MLPMDTQRIRAWMVIRGSYTHDNAAAVQSLDENRLEEYVVVRTDIVTSLNAQESGMVVPIDALMGSDDIYEHLYAIRDQIVETLKLGPEDYDLLEVQSPTDAAPPHIVSGYITKEEAHAAIDRGERGGKPGRQDYSPGFNPWG